ncbi:MAG TPA: vanadium-dependent haloperoxidase, partial [Thermoanaerobaculia bacterium]|nr:vanadium-dependent haloperoxidase [Thermoanaerobaculia bacterium]
LLPDDSTDGKGQTDSLALSRRRFLGGLGGAAAAAMASGVVGLEALANPSAANAAAGPDLGLVTEASGTAATRARRNACWAHRKNQADYWWHGGNVSHPVNGDEALYPNRIANYSKSMPHNSFGEVDLDAYDSLLAAIKSGKSTDYDAMILGPGARKQTSPQCGLAFDMEGADSHGVAVPPPPALASKEQAGEMVENYWMALLRDVNYLDYDSSPLAAAAAADLSSFGADFKGPRDANGKVTPQTLFRDNGPGISDGPLTSQFMWLNTPFGVEYVERKMWTAGPGSDHMQSFDEWLAVQNGLVLGKNSFLGTRRYVINGRDISAWVHVDVLFQAYFNACLILITPPDKSDIGGGIGCPFNPGNPYLGNETQDGFCTFGPPAAKSLMCEVASRCLKATWHKKWQVHRRLRPEAYAGLVEVQLNQSPGRYNGALHSSLFSATVLDQIATYNGGAALLPMAFPEGSPTHPSYTAGHATVAGACVTILKAIFDTENRPIPHPVVPTADGSALVPFTGAALTIEGELNKLASNIASGRNIAGVHWRSDSFNSLRIGQAVAISILQEQTLLHNEANPFYTFRGFDGERIVVRKGGVFSS